MTENYDVPVDINQASAEALTSVSGIGKSLAERIIGNRPYSDLNELVQVSGINEVKLGSLLPCLTINKETAKDSPSTPEISLPQQKILSEKPITVLGNTEAFVFLEDRNERQDALLIVFGGFIIGLIILLLRRSNE